MIAHHVPIGWNETGQMSQFIVTVDEKQAVTVVEMPKAA